MKRTVHLLDRLNGSGRFELVATGSIIFLPMRQSLFYFTGAGKFSLTHGLRYLKRDVKSDVRTLNCVSGVTFAPPRQTQMTLGKCRNAT